jgi:hypothetical protein
MKYLLKKLLDATTPGRIGVRKFWRSLHEVFEKSIRRGYDLPQIKELIREHQVFIISL